MRCLSHAKGNCAARVGLKRLLGAIKAPQAAGEQRVCLDGARLVVLDPRSLSIELPREKAPGARGWPLMRSCRAHELSSVSPTQSSPWRLTNPSACVRADASLMAAQRPHVARLLVWLNDEEGDAGVLRSNLALLIRRSGGELAPVRAPGRPPR